MRKDRTYESTTWLNNMVLIGNTDERGKAWHYSASSQGSEPNHYPGSIPVEDINRRLFGWEPVEVPLEVTLPDGTVIENTGRKSIVRPAFQGMDPAVLGVFKDGYTPHSYSEYLLNTAVNMTDNPDTSIISAGLLSNGGKAWVQIALTEPQTVADFAYMPFVSASTSMDGTLSTSYVRGVNAITCDNSLAEALYNRDKIKISARHSKYSKVTLSALRETLGILVEVSDEFEETINYWINQKVNEKQFDEFIQIQAPDNPDSARGATVAEKMRDQLYDLWNDDERVTPWKGTAFGIKQLMNTYNQHERRTNKGRSKAERNYGAMVSGTFAKQDAKVDEDLIKVLQLV